MNIVDCVDVARVRVSHCTLFKGVDAARLAGVIAKDEDNVAKGVTCTREGIVGCMMAFRM